MENQNPKTSPILPTQPQNIPTEQSQSIPPPIKTRGAFNWLKLLIIAVVIIFAVSIIGVGTFLLGSNKNTPKTVVQITPSPTANPTPTIDPTANWKTYRNNIDNFSFKYPPNYSDSYDYATNPENRNYISTEVGWPLLSVEKILDNYALLEKNNIDNALKTKDLIDGFMYSDSQDVKVGDNTFRVYYVNYADSGLDVNGHPKLMPAGGPLKYFQAEGFINKNLYRFTLIDISLYGNSILDEPTAEEKKKARQILVDIVSTFKFTQ